jgi:biopolymer transport protein TolR|tara:strand:+ start:4212 stop:4658 length:447 start_codon:yes stop_codon:yes gene_type:complete
MQIGPKAASRSTRRQKFTSRNFVPMSEINVTPFVDIMLVLLIIFMVAAPLLSVGVEVDLPNTQAKPLAIEKEKPLTLTMDKESNIFINEVQIKKEDIRTKLLAIRKERKSDEIYLRASKNIEYQKVASVLALVSNIGYSQISLVTDVE